MSECDIQFSNWVVAALISCMQPEVEKQATFVAVTWCSECLDSGCCSELQQLVSLSVAASSAPVPMQSCFLDLPLPLELSTPFSIFFSRPGYLVVWQLAIFSKWELYDTNSVYGLKVSGVVGTHRSWVTGAQAQWFLNFCTPYRTVYFLA